MPTGVTSVPGSDVSMSGESIAGVGLATTVVAAVIIAKEKQKTKSYTVYLLRDPTNNAVKYVGRTSNYSQRMYMHQLNPNRKYLVPDIIKSGLDYTQARALEQAYIFFYSTLNKDDKSMNQINGVNKLRKDYADIMKTGTVLMMQ